MRHLAHRAGRRNDALATLPTYTANGLAFDATTHLFYVTAPDSPTTGSPSIMSVDAKGNARVIAGGSTTGQADGTGPQASFEAPTGIALDTSDGALYVADGDLVRRVTPAGVVTTVTKPGALGYNSSGAPTGLAYDAKSHLLYAADSNFDAVLSISPQAGTVAVLAGQCLARGKPSQGTCDAVARDGKGLRALFAGPSGIASDPTTGNLYVADAGNGAVREIDTTGNVVTLAGNGIPAEVDGAGQNAEFDAPIALAIDTTRHLLSVTDVPAYPAKPALRSVTVLGSPPPPPNTPIALFDTVSLDAEPFAIDWRPTKPASKTLAYSETTGRVARLSTTGISAEKVDPLDAFEGPFDAVLGADGSAWFVGTAAPLGLALDHLTLAGEFVQSSVGNIATGSDNPDALTLGPDGNVWFALSPLMGGTTVGFVTPAGAVTMFSPILTSSFASITTLAFAADGTLWVSNGTSLAQLNVAGSVLRVIDYGVNYLTQGPDGDIWFSQPDAIGTLDAKGVVVVYPIVAPKTYCQGADVCRGIDAIATGSDGALWFAENGAIGRLTTDGSFSETQVLAARSYPSDMTGGPDGNIWFVDAGSQKIGRVTIR